eukprot:TRINITY_DN55554_c0_g1_i1.p1 TRINITY_DN55554_c0_g1~~TRINITY_DN55554_c0_g1_i1.p1  ORF type:complete len:219 (+),score=31.19 TRINITY_DN55554_c0_g1_i1:543-1199(+)
MDFDMACQSSDELARSVLCGSIGYIAPEVIMNKVWSCGSDVFSLGCVVYFMVAKQHPFVKKPVTREAVLESTVECNLRFGRRFDEMSLTYSAFVSSIVVREPEQRSSTQQASAHPWLSKEEAAKRAEQAAHDAVAKSPGSTTLFSASDETWSTSLGSERFDSVLSSSAGGRTLAKPRSSRLEVMGGNLVRRLSRIIERRRVTTSTVTRMESSAERTTS